MVRLMDDAVVRAMARWPNVPHVYGWLSLDQRVSGDYKGARLVTSNCAILSPETVLWATGRMRFKTGRNECL